MISKFKAMAAVVAAACAASGLMASVGSAASFNSEANHTILEGAQVTVNEFEISAGLFECEEVTFQGTIAATSTGAVTVTPTYDECFGFGLEADVNMNGCDYLITATGQIHIEGCGAGEHIITTVLPDFWGPGEPLCTLTVPEQTVTGMSFQNTGTGTTRNTDATANISGIAYEIVGGEGLCGEEGLEENGTYAGTVTVQGFNTAGGHVGTHHTP